MIRINFSKQVRKYLKKLPAKHAKQVARKIVEMRQQPFPNDVEKLIHSHYYRVDIGEYRLFYYMDDNILYLTVLGKRNDSELYKILK